MKIDCAKLDRLAQVFFEVPLDYGRHLAEGYYIGVDGEHGIAEKSVVRLHIVKHRGLLFRCNNFLMFLLLSVF